MLWQQVEKDIYENNKNINSQINHDSETVIKDKAQVAAIPKIERSLPIRTNRAKNRRKRDNNSNKMPINDHLQSISIPKKFSSLSAGMVIMQRKSTTTKSLDFE